GCHVKEAFRPQEEPVLWARQAARHAQMLVKGRMRCSRIKLHILCPPFSIESAAHRDGFEQRGLPGPILTDKKCDFGMQFKDIQMSHSREVKWVSVKTRHGVALKFD